MCIVKNKFVVIDIREPKRFVACGCGSWLRVFGYRVAFLRFGGSNRQRERAREHDERKEMHQGSS